MPVQRKNDTHLPPNVVFKHGAYYLLKREEGKKKWIWLGRTFPESMKKWAELVSLPFKNDKMNAVIDRYMKEIAPLGSPRTYQNKLKAIPWLKDAFGHLRPDEVTPVLIYEYMDFRAKSSVFTANKEKSILSHIFSYAIRWGLVTDNPCAHVKSLPEPKNEREVTQLEYDAVYSVATPLIKLVMDIIDLLALRRTDLVALKKANFNDDGLLAYISKTKEWQLFRWDNQGKLKAIQVNAKKLRGNLQSMYLLSTEKGQPYTVDGIATLFRRSVLKAIKKETIKETFSLHDLRSKAAKDATKQYGIEYARKLLGHKDQSMTAEYIKGAKEVILLNRHDVLVDNEEFGRREVKNDKK